MSGSYQIIIKKKTHFNRNRVPIEKSLFFIGGLFLMIFLVLLSLKVGILKMNMRLLILSLMKRLRMNFLIMV